jgi:HEAT repeat protein
MPVTMQQVLAHIDKDEPDYEKAAAELGPEALPHLAMIIEADDPLRAAKAAYLATLISDPAADEVVRKAANHSDAQVRVAVAHGLLSADEAAPDEVLAKLLGDSDAGVRKTALRTVGKLNRPALRARVEAIASDDPEKFLRDAATETRKKMKSK